MLLCLASIKGSPGVTTTALALAACWPASWRRVLVEADPAGGDLAARYGLPLTPGLVSLAAAARRSTDPELVWEHAQELPGGLPVVAGPTRADQAHAALAAVCGADGRAGVLGAFTGRGDVVAVVDCGRLDRDPVTSGVIASGGSAAAGRATPSRRAGASRGPRGAVRGRAGAHPAAARRAGLPGWRGCPRGRAERAGQRAAGPQDRRGVVRAGRLPTADPVSAGAGGGTDRRGTGRRSPPPRTHRRPRWAPASTPWATSNGNHARGMPAGSRDGHRP